MEELEDVLPEMRAVVAQYLDGHLGFEATARALAEIYRRTLPPEAGEAVRQKETPKARQLRLKPLSPSQWMNPTSSLGPSIQITGMKPFVLAPGRSADDEKKAMAVFSKALHLLFGDPGPANFRLGP